MVVAMTGYGTAFLVMLGFVLAEQGWLRLRRGRASDWDDVVANLNSGHIVMWVLRGVELMLYVLVLEHASFGWAAAWPPVAQWLFGFIAWDFCFWVMHMMHHRIPALWAVHVVHHHGQRMDLTLGIRNSWYSSLSNFPFIAPLAVLGLPADVFAAVSSILYTHQLYNHTALVGKSGVLDRILVTPSNHRVHHCVDPRCLNRNFGGSLLVWDRLFGTYQPELPDIPLVYGVKGQVAPRNPLLANHGALGRRWHGAAIGRRRASSGYVGLGGIMLFCLVAFAVARAPDAPGQFALFGSIALCSIALGAVSDGARWALPSWAAMTALLLPAWFAVYGAGTERGGMLLAALLGLHGLANHFFAKAS
jgi:sterol desaturase/sphingolipid hydroxylase (fatty acid hydroxylase superfamily)